MSTKKKSTTTSNQTQTSAPPSWTMPGIENAAGRVTNILEQGPPPAYTGDFTAAPNAGLNQQIVDAFTGSATRAGETANFAQGQMEALFQPRDMRSELDAAITAAIEPTFRTLRERVLPGITNSALQSGAYSNDRAMGVLPQMAIREATENAQRIAATMGYEGLQAEENRRLQRASMLPELTDTIMRMDASRGDLLTRASDQDVALREAIINNNLAKHDYAVRQPYEGLDIATQLLAQLSGNYGTVNSQGKTSTVEKTSGLGPILQGALGLGMAVAGMPGGGLGGLLGGAAQGAKVAPAASIFGKSGNPAGIY